MSLLDPPAFLQQSRLNKRKRPASSPEDDFPSSLPSHLPHDSINPHSHTPGIVAQFAIAGLSETDLDPAQQIPDFPHRGLDRKSVGRIEIEPEPEEEPDTDADEDAAPTKKKTTQRRRGGHFDVLLQSIHHFLDQGEIEKASRAYGVLLQLRPTGGPVDLRHHSLWAIGAEILMRQGEQTSSGDDKPEDEKKALPKRWGRAANMNKVKVYFDTLIQQHPYDYKHPQSISALDFWLALLSCEIHNTHTEHVLALERLARDADQDSRRGSFGHDDSFGSDDTENQEVRLAQRKEELRLQALGAMKDVTKRMDELMQDMPYSRNQHYLRLRAMASLYIADLVLPTGPTSAARFQQAQRTRQMEQKTARDELQKIITHGGELDEAAMAVLNPSEDSEEDTSIPLYSSLPIRGL
ncbi:uncharacterized protein NECHADRAFT_50250 [Fusarium vanettenii 77-13-4]|uniref:Uncharacterized protein n=1 Tax=Fusarium vanettenii (strain ATCC MYA-4622 / CBS 123669 / FGSC 9596 / NRRL 45880 / 77-13-4) TaxID=660122 RepID=C7ZPN6_FUSV7|nr:uncharacterized protein NECHADRAFT_50250 [Fusarium vanettenii 77-13-4]EEU34386.1 hypothetical protein NECHADRAFT_50250 [Fusarium vanettenii 77-13-4]